MPDDRGVLGSLSDADALFLDYDGTIADLGATLDEHAVAQVAVASDDGTRHHVRARPDPGARTDPIGLDERCRMDVDSWERRDSH